jgi:hypothetical protein
MAPLSATDQIATGRTERGAGTTANTIQTRGRILLHLEGNLGVAVMLDLLNFFI